MMQPAELSADFTMAMRVKADVSPQSLHWALASTPSLDGSFAMYLNAIFGEDSAGTAQE